MHDTDSIIVRRLDGTGRYLTQVGIWQLVCATSAGINLAASLQPINLRKNIAFFLWLHHLLR